MIKTSLITPFIVHVRSALLPCKLERGREKDPSIAPTMITMLGKLIPRFDYRPNTAT